MKYKNRLIVPTVVTLSLLGLSDVTSADEKNNDSPSFETATEESISTSESSTDANDVNENAQVTTSNEFEGTKNQISQPVNEKSDDQIHNSDEQYKTNDISSNLSESKKISVSESEDESQASNVSSSENSHDRSEQEGEVKTSAAEITDETKKSTEPNVNDVSDDGSESKNTPASESAAESQAPKVRPSESNNDRPEETQVDNSDEKNALEQKENSEDQLENLESENTEISNHKENIPSHNIESTQEKQLPDGEKDIQVNDESAIGKEKNTSDVNKSESENTEEAKEQVVDTSTEAQLDPDNIEEEKEEVVESEAEIFGLRTFILPSSATLKAETFKKSVDAVPQYDDAYYAAKVSSGPNSGRYSPVTSDDSESLGWLENRTLFISEQAKYNGTTFYKIHSGIDGPMQGWVKEEDLRLFDMTKPKNHKKTYDIKLDKHHLLTDPWGTANQYVKRLDRYGDTPFHAEKYLELGAHTYYYGKIGNDHGWLEESRLVDTSRTPFYRDMKVAARVKSGENSGRYSPVTSKNSVSLGWLENRTLFITEQAKYQGTTFYKIHSGIDGPMQGWVKSQDLRLFDTTNPVAHKKDYAIYQPGHYLLTDPWGTANQYIKQLSTYGNSLFKAEKSMKLGAHTYYYGKIGNDYGWLEESRVKPAPDKPVAPSPSVKTVRYNQSFNQVLNTQMNLSSKPQAWANGGGWRNATRSEVARFLDTSNQTSETWMYTFLDLDRSQNIASSTLNNRLLSGKGTLSNQGSAFLNAANTQGINEVYLISHAIHETGNGTSTLAQGVRLDSNGNISSNGKKYYNMYGIGAYDYNPVLAGARYAQQMGWDTPAKAIVGGARFISQSYFNRGQTTLYSMRWNPLNPGTYQYATDVNWAYATARNLQNYYNQLDIKGRYYTKHIF
ncbi:N-acetylglucosaminidase [Salinicoccus halodurans]|uniref:Bifunctional autolysin n=1 Tax=Salinicoccus halodurans TaxID=407035 RepID=A0AA94HFV7_9STAP|nr:N-acetylglucosaminidase [Salinicoccus halodurans]SFK81150.1 bifunctional autolysin [Salinicoccus halodurans]